MTATTQQNPPPKGRFGPPSKGPWRNRVENRGPIAFRPGEFVVSGEPGRDAIARLVEARFKTEPRTAHIIEGYWLVYVENEGLRAGGDVAALVAEGRAQGFDVEPNYVVFAHSGWGSGCCGGCGGCGCGSMGGNPFMGNPFMGNPFMGNPFMGNPFMGNPFMGNPFMGNPFMGNPFMGNPFMGNPFMGNPFMGNPFMGNPFMGNATGPQHSSAQPAKKPASAATLTLPEGRSRAVILDTGLAVTDHLPAMLSKYDATTAVDDRDTPDELGDGFLDPAAGHGTFIAGIIEQLAPSQEVRVSAVLSTFGDGDVATISHRLDTLRAEGAFDNRTVLNMSLGAYADARMNLLETAIRKVQQTGAVVVASAGNDAHIVAIVSCGPPRCRWRWFDRRVRTGLVLELRFVGAGVRARFRGREFVLPFVRRQTRSGWSSTGSGRVRELGPMDRHIVCGSDRRRCAHAAHGAA